MSNHISLSPNQLNLKVRMSNPKTATMLEITSSLRLDGVDNNLSITFKNHMPTIPYYYPSGPLQVMQSIRRQFYTSLLRMKSSVISNCTVSIMPNFPH
jgi:hypothetical protein